MESPEVGVVRGSSHGSNSTGTVYRECLKNHAATLGSYATDGCGEFMPCAGVGSPDTAASGGRLRCGACGCHRNFHRKLVVKQDERLEFVRCGSLVETPEAGFSRKRFRTKFSTEQKDRMQELAEKMGWRIQKEEELAIQTLCEENGISRRVFKVWMHNHKNSSANNASSPAQHS